MKIVPIDKYNYNNLSREVTLAFIPSDMPDPVIAEPMYVATPGYITLLKLSQAIDIVFILPVIIVSGLYAIIIKILLHRNKNTEEKKKKLKKELKISLIIIGICLIICLLPKVVVFLLSIF